MSYSRLSTGLANIIAAESKIDDEQRQVVAYAIENFILAIAGFILILMTGYLFQAMMPAAAAAITGGLLRRVSGGAHAKTAVRCLFSGAIAYGALGVLAKYTAVYIPGKTIVYCGLLVALLIVSIYAPVDCPAKRIKSLILRRKLKLASIVFILGLFGLSIAVKQSFQLIDALTMGAVYQSITLLPIFNGGGESIA